jgi:hypothetical protein
MSSARTSNSPGRHVDLDVAAGDAPGRGVQHQVAGGEGGRGGVGAAPLQGAQPGEEFVERERLGEVVVGAGVQAGDAIGDLAAGGQHEHRDPVPGSPQPLADGDTVQAGQHHVEHDRVETAGRRGVQPVGSGVPGLGVVAGLGQAAGEQPGEAPLVLHHQYAHAAQCTTSAVTAGVGRPVARLHVCFMWRL